MDLLVKDGKVKTQKKVLGTEFIKSFEQFLLISQIFCSAPININLSSKVVKHQKIFSAFHFMFGLLICVAVCFATYLHHKSLDLKSLGFLTSVLYVGEYGISTFNLVLVIIGCQHQKKFYRLFFNRLVNIQLMLCQCGIESNSKPVQDYLKKSLILYVAFFAIVIVVDIFYSKMSVESFVSSSTVYTVPNVVSTLALTQCSFVTRCLTHKLRAINLYLGNFAKKTNQHHLMFVNVLASNNEEQLVVLELDKLRCQHAELSRLMELLNECFGLLIVLTLIAAYVILSTQFYAFYKMIEGFDESNIWLVVYTVLWVILHLGKVFMILNPIEDFSDEKRLTGNLLFEINRDLRKSKTCRALKRFADQLLHEKTPPNALRIINLDMTIFGTMLGVLTTYLIILIQFDATARGVKLECNVTSSAEEN